MNLNEIEQVLQNARTEVSIVQSFKAFASALQYSIPAYANQLPKIEEELRIAKINVKSLNHVRLRILFPIKEVDCD